MNRFRIVPAFREFQLLCGPTRDESTLFASHPGWESRAHAGACTESDAFRTAFGQRRAPSGTDLGHPDFEGFDVVL